MLITGTTYSVSHYKEFEKTGNKDIFENIIDSMIMDGIAGMNESFRRAISSLPKDKKRLAILSILDKDRNLFAKIKESITDINLSKIDHVKNIILMLREYVKIAEVEKKKFGEVMTPLDLVKEMLNTLPTEVWSNPNLKWLDPANGTGPFPAVVIYKLMKGLESWEPDADKRYKHIIENMIYVCELQPKNMFLYLCTVDPKDELACNIYTGSFLEEGFDYHMKNVWGVEKFDIVIGNPPYQDGTKTQGKNSSLWTKFIIKSNSYINKYLLFITPFSWIAPSETQKNELKDVFFKNNLIELNTECSKYFNVASTFSYFLIEKSDCYKSTKVSNYQFNLNLPFLPKKICIESISICKKIFFSDDKKLDFSCGLRNDNISEEGNYFVWYGNNLKKSDILGKNWSKKKVIVNKPGYLNPRFDDGLYNTSANNYWVEVNDKKEADNLISFFNTKLSSKIIENLCKYSGYNSLGVLKRLPAILLDNRWDDKNMATYFGLTKEELDFLEKL